MKDTLFSKAEREAGASAAGGIQEAFVRDDSGTLDDLSASGITVKQPTQPASIFDRAVLLSLSFGRYGISKKVDSRLINTEADKALLKITKQIIDSPEWDAIKKHDSATGKLVERYTLPSQFRRGIYLLPIKFVVAVDEILSGRAIDRKPLVEAFLSVYSSAVNAAQVRLGPLYNSRDYLSVWDVEARFYMEYSFIECSVPGQLGKLNVELAKRENDKFAAGIRSALDEGVAVVRLMFKDLVDHMILRLQPDPDGKPKRFTKPLIANLDSFCGELFDGKNDVLGDAELSALVTKMRALLNGVDSADLKSDSLREAVLAGASNIKLALDELVTTSPGRRITLTADSDSAW